MFNKGPTRCEHEVSLPHRTHCPVDLADGVFEQMAVDIGHLSTLGDLRLRQRQISERWAAFCDDHPDHPTVCAFAASGQDYNRSGFALLSLCLPPDCTYTGTVTTGPTGHLANIWHQVRFLPRSTAPVLVQNGLFIQGWLNAAVLTGRGGLLHHLYLYHGKAAGLAFLDQCRRKMIRSTLTLSSIRCSALPRAPVCIAITTRWVWTTVSCRTPRA